MMGLGGVTSRSHQKKGILIYTRNVHFTIQSFVNH